MVELISTKLPFEEPTDRVDVYYLETRELNSQVLNQILVKRIINLFGYEIWTVDGTVIRDLVDVDFVEGGNPARYQYIPVNQIWVEDNLAEEDLIATVFHELYELDLMLANKSYSDAHDSASELEKQIRSYLIK